jgi:hypothetical protein
VELLARHAGTAPSRARQLVHALARAYAREGLAVMLGAWPPATSLVDTRVARLAVLIRELANAEPPPTADELSVLLKITSAQARNVLRTYQARFEPRR